MSSLKFGLVAVILTVAGKLLAFGRDVVMSKYFGAGSATDAFFIANTIPGVLWASALVTINVVFLPLYVAKRAAGHEPAANFVNQSIQIYLLLALAMTSVCVLAAGPIVQLSAPGPALVRVTPTVEERKTPSQLVVTVECRRVQ